MKKIKDISEQKGITLVALIITIIILIILAAVSIKAVLDMNFIDLASNAAINYAESQAEEDKQMNNIDSYLKSTIKKIEDNEFGIGDDEPKPSTTPTPNPGKNPGGVITDIITDEIIIPGANSDLIVDNVGKTVDYTYTTKSIDIKKFEDYCTVENTDKVVSNWVVYAEDTEYLYAMRTRMHSFWNRSKLL